MCGLILISFNFIGRHFVSPSVDNGIMKRIPLNRTVSIISSYYDTSVII